jgi:hypothetical protein
VGAAPVKDCSFTSSEESYGSLLGTLGFIGASSWGSLKRGEDSGENHAGYEKVEIFDRVLQPEWPTGHAIGTVAPSDW